MRLAMMVLLLLPALSAQAEVYRCLVEGRPMYTDRPCAAGAVPHALPDISALPSPGASDLAREHDARRERELETRRQNDAAWLDDHAERKVLKDMSADEVRRALGSPDEVERSGSREQWAYGAGKQRRTVVFEAGKVVKQTGKK